MRMSTRTRAPLALAALVAATVACTDTAGVEDTATSGGGDDKDAGQFVDGELQRLGDGFPSQPLTIMVLDEGGSDDGLYARQLQKAASDLSPVDVRVLDRPDFGTYGIWEALDFVAGESGGSDGHILPVVTVPGSTIDLIGTPVVEELGVSMEDLNHVLITELVPYLITTRADAPWGDSMEEFVEYAKANPGKVRYISRGPGAGPDIAFQYYRIAGDFEVNTSVGGSHSEILTAIGAGQGDVAVSLPGAAVPFIEDERVRVLGCSLEQDPCEGPWGEAPAASTVVGADPDQWGSNRGVVVSPETPDEHREWLETLLRKAVEDPEFKESRETVPGLTLTTLDNAEALEVQQQGYDAAYEILDQLGRVDPTVEKAAG